MGLFGNRKKKKSSSTVAKDRLKLVLVYDRTGTSSNNDMIEMMKKDIMGVISKYIDIDEREFELDIKTIKTPGEGISSELVANIPIKNVKKIGKSKAK